MIVIAGRNYTDFYGGAEVLVNNIAQELNKRNISFGIIGHPENENVKQFRNNNISFSFFDYRQDKIVLNSNDLVIFFKHTPDLLKIKGKPKILFWNILSLSLLNHNKSSKKTIVHKMSNLFFYVLTKQLYNKLMINHSLVFMDKNSYDDVNLKYNLRSKPLYLPIPIEIKNIANHTRKSSEDFFNITYLGRGDEIWKIKPVIKLLNDLNGLCPPKKIKLHIITNNDVLFKKHLPKVNKIETKYVIGIKGDELRKYLITKSSLHFAMGTSALDGAICKVPTILLDASYRDFPENYKYKWLFESEYYSLGSFIERIPFTGTHTIQEVMQAILSNYDTYANKCYEYVLLNHSIQKTVDKIFEISIEARLDRYLRHTKAYWSNKLRDRKL